MRRVCNINSLAKVSFPPCVNRFLTIPAPDHGGDGSASAAQPDRDGPGVGVVA